MTNDLITNEADLLAEHLAARADQLAKDKVVQQAKHQEWLARQQDEHRQTNLKRSAHLTKIAACVAAPHKATVNAEAFKLVIDGVDTSYHVDFSEQREHVSSWRSRPSGRYRFSVGDYGSRVSYPQRKDGTFNYAAIAEALVCYADKKNTEAKLANQRRANAKRTLPDTVAAIFPDAKKAEYQDVVSASSSPEMPIRFKFAIDRAMTADDAIKLAAAIRSCGIKLHYGK